MSLTKTSLIDAKIKAYKEFADMIIKKIEEDCSFVDNDICARILVLTEDIDNILKELVGDE